MIFAVFQQMLHATRYSMGFLFRFPSPFFIPRSHKTTFLLRVPIPTYLAFSTTTSRFFSLHP